MKMTPHDIRFKATTLLSESKNITADDNDKPVFKLPVDLKTILNNLGILAGTDPDLTTKTDAYSFCFEGTRYISVPPTLTEEELYTTVALHIGYHLFYLDPKKPFKETKYEDMSPAEQLAYLHDEERETSVTRLFARELLIPYGAIGDYSTPGQLADACKVPFEMAAAAYWNYHCDTDFAE
mgnify:CR=1 FL=1